MGRRAIQRAARGRKQALEIGRGGDRAVVHRPVHGQATLFEEPEGRVFASLDLRCLKNLPVAHGRRIHETQKPFRAQLIGRRTIETILRTDVYGWRIGQTPGPKQRVELGAVVRAEEHGMTRQGKAFGAGDEIPGDSR